MMSVLCVVGCLADAVQQKIDDFLRLGEPLVAEDGMGERKGDGPQRAGRLHGVEHAADLGQARSAQRSALLSVRCRPAASARKLS